MPKSDLTREDLKRMRERLCGVDSAIRLDTPVWFDSSDVLDLLDLVEELAWALDAEPSTVMNLDSQTRYMKALNRARALLPKGDETEDPK